jgi:hypothetical protein
LPLFTEVRGIEILRSSSNRIPRKSTCEMRHRAGAFGGSGLYNALGRAFSPLLARPSHCALSTLHGTLGGATMTTPGGPGTQPRVGQLPVFGAPASIMGSGLSHSAPALRFALLQLSAWQWFSEASLARYRCEFSLSSSTIFRPSIISKVKRTMPLSLPLCSK